MTKPEKYRNFINEYDEGNLNFDNVQYRAGAGITCQFGLVEGYRIVDGKFYWDSVRIHTGVDRAGYYNNRWMPIENKVIAPFNFQRSQIIDYGHDHVYGAIIRLFQDEYGFEMRIVHMNPSIDIEPLILNDLKLNKPIKRNTLLGRSGKYGMADGEHTHTEIVSYELTNPILNFLLYEKFGESFMNPYNKEYIFRYYRSTEYFKNKSDKEILEHYQSMLSSRQITDANFFNKYSFRFIDWYSPNHNQERTRYSSQLLFNGL